MNQVIFDGDCPVCTGLKDFAEEKSGKAHIQFTPFQSEFFSEVAAGLTEEEASQALYVITPNGKRLQGARAVFEIMSELPGLWGKIGRVLRLPPFYWIAEPFYRLFAKHRHGVSKILQP